MTGVHTEAARTAIRELGHPPVNCPICGCPGYVTDLQDTSVQVTHPFRSYPCRFTVPAPATSGRSFVSWSEIREQQPR